MVESVVFTGPAAAEFRRAPCTRAGHHAYLGGLLEHTVAVATLVGELCTLHPRLDSDLLTAAAILHDVGKTREFTYGAEFQVSDEGRMLGHLALGAEIVGAAAASLPAERRLALLHCVLSHHGPDAAPGRGQGPQRGFATPGGARALSPERARRLGQGCARGCGALSPRRISCVAITSSSAANDSSSTRSETALAISTPATTPTGDRAPIQSPSRRRTLPAARCRQAPTIATGSTATSEVATASICG